MRGLLRIFSRLSSYSMTGYLFWLASIRRILSMYQCGLTGSLPSSFAFLTGLTQLALYGNALYGSLTPLTSLRALAALDGHGNLFGGSFPSDLAAMTKLTYVSLPFIPELSGAQGTMP